MKQLTRNWFSVFFWFKFFTYLFLQKLNVSTIKNIRIKLIQSINTNMFWLEFDLL